MAQNYTRQSSFADGDTITASLFNNEFNQVVNAFSYSASSDSSTGHKHDGTAGQGGNIPKIGDIDFLNKIVVDSTNNRWGIFVEVAGGPVEQVRIQDGAIVPVTTNDIDLGTASLQFKDIFIDGTANIDSLVLSSGSTVTAILDEDDLVSDSATALATQQSIKAYVDAQVTAQDLDIVGDTGTDAIDLDSETLTFTGGTGITSVVTAGTVTHNIDSTVATLTGTQTLTNKTITSPDIDGGTVDGADITVGAAKTLDVSAGTLTLADNQISGDKVEGGTIAAITITAMTGTLQTAAQPNVTSLGTIASLVATTADINGGTIDGTTLGATTPASVAATTGSFSSTLGVTGAATFSSTVRSTGYSLTDATSQYYHFDAASGNNFMGLTAAHTLTTYTNGVARTTLDANGNLGLGVVPSAWNSGYKAMQLLTGALYGTNSRDTNLGANVFVNAGGGYAYIQSSFATNYTQFNGAHSWYTAPSGTAGDAISFTQAMTLDASGTLKSTVNGAVANLLLENDADTPYMAFTESGAAQFFIGESSIVGGGGGYDIYATSGQGISFFTNALRRVDIDTSGNLLVGTTSAFGTTGTTINSAGLIYSSADGDRSGQFDRTTDDGEIVRFSKAGTTVGSIGTNGGVPYLSGPLAGGIKLSYYDATYGLIFPVTTTGAIANGTHDLGYSAAKFRDLYLSGSAYTPVVQGLGDEAGLTFGGAVVAPRKNNAAADGTVDLGVAGARFKDLYLSGGVYLGGTGAANHAG
jgi:hypothetical protein